MTSLRILSSGILPKIAGMSSTYVSTFFKYTGPGRATVLALTVTRIYPDLKYLRHNNSCQSSPLPPLEEPSSKSSGSESSSPILRLLLPKRFLLAVTSETTKIGLKIRVVQTYIVDRNNS